MDGRCRAAFDEAAHVAISITPRTAWVAFERHLGSPPTRLPGMVCLIATLMAESNISILNVSSHDRDFLLVQSSDVDSAKAVIQHRLERDVTGLKGVDH